MIHILSKLERLIHLQVFDKEIFATQFIIGADLNDVEGVVEIEPNVKFELGIGCKDEDEY